MKVAPVILALAVLAFGCAVQYGCQPLSQAERNAIRARAAETPAPKPKPPAPTKPAPVACTENCARSSDDQAVVVSPIPGGVPMGSGLYMSVR